MVHLANLSAAVSIFDGRIRPLRDTKALARRRMANAAAQAATRVCTCEALGRHDATTAPLPSAASDVRLPSHYYCNTWSTPDNASKTVSHTEDRTVQKLMPLALRRDRRSVQPKRPAAQQYCKFTYNAATDGSRCGSWKGMTAHGAQHDVYREAVDVHLRRLCLSQPGTWFKLFPGKPRADTTSANVRSELPLIAHPQLRKPTCVFASMASALAYCGDTAAAQLVADAASASLKQSRHPMDLLADLANSKTLAGYRCITFPKRSSVCPFSIAASCLTACQLLAQDGGVAHVVTVHDNYVFDSTQSRALPLSSANLDRCCSSGSHYSKYCCVLRAVQLIRPMPKKRRCRSSVCETHCARQKVAAIAAVGSAHARTGTRN